MVSVRVIGDEHDRDLGVVDLAAVPGKGDFIMLPALYPTVDKTMDTWEVVSVTWRMPDGARTVATLRVY